MFGNKNTSHVTNQHNAFTTDQNALCDEQHRQTLNCSQNLLNGSFSKVYILRHINLSYLSYYEAVDWYS